MGRGPSTYVLRGSELATARSATETNVTDRRHGVDPNKNIGTQHVHVAALAATIPVLVDSYILVSYT